MFKLYLYGIEITLQTQAIRLNFLFKLYLYGIEMTQSKNRKIA